MIRVEPELIFCLILDQNDQDISLSILYDLLKSCQYAISFSLSAVNELLRRAGFVDN